MPSQVERAWEEAFVGDDAAAREAATPELRDFIRRTLARGFGRQLDDATLEDLTQDALLRVVDRVGDFQGRSRFRTWAASIAVNLALSELRRRRHRHVDLDTAIDAGRAAVAPVAGRSRARDDRDASLSEAIEVALTDRQRQALLAELGGLPMVEVARRLGTTRGALYKLLHDARKRLRRHFEERGLAASDLLLGGDDGDE